MKVTTVVVSGLAVLNTALGAVAPRDVDVELPQAANQDYFKRDTIPPLHDHEKRRGGGGGGGGRGGGSSGSSGSSGGGGVSGGGGRGSPLSSQGGSTRQGSGPSPNFGGGRYYGGGAAVPYKSGQPSRSGITPVLFGVGLASLAFWPGVWLYGAYLYPYSNPYRFYNASSQMNETKPVTCGCDPYAVCGCDENGDTQYLADLIGNGSYAHLNHTLVTVADVNGTQRILINGTLPNGTTASGGDEDAFSSEAAAQVILRNLGWWPVVATVGALVFMH